MIRQNDIRLVVIDRSHAPFLVRWKNEGAGNKLLKIYKKTNVYEQKANIAIWAYNNADELHLTAVRNKLPVGYAVIGHINWMHRKCKIVLYAEDLETEKTILTALIGRRLPDMNINKVSIDVLLDDIERVKMYELLGFTTEVRKRQHFFAEGKHSTVLEMALLIPELESERTKNQINSN